MNVELKVKIFAGISLFLLSMLVVGLYSFEVGKQIGYKEGYAQADQDWKDYLNEYWGPFVDIVYQEGYNDGFMDGYLWGYVEAWVEYGAGEEFGYPDGGFVP